MCHSRTVNNKINSLHERCLRVIYNDQISSAKELLERDGSVPIHNKNIHILATEMFKVYNNMAPPLRTFQFHLLEVCIMGKIWDFVLTEFKEVKTLNTFKSRIKQ